MSDTEKESRLSEPYSDFFWRPTGATPAWRHDDVWFHDWAVNSDGKIVHTADGGDTWTEQLHLASTWLRCIGFADEKTGWMGSVTEPERALSHT